MPLKTWLGLFLCNFAWAMNPTVAKHLIHELGPEHTAWLRYSVALLAYILVRAGMRLGSGKRLQKPNPLFMPLQQKKDLWVVIAIGSATCFFSPLTQMFGLHASTAVNNSIMVTFEPIFTVILGWLLLGEGLLRSHFVSFFLAILGFLFISNAFRAQGEQSFLSYLGSGDLILLAAVAGEAVYSVLARRLTKQYSGAMIFGTAMLVGVILLSLVVLPWRGMPPLQNLSSVGWGALAWLGILGTAIPYLYWLHALNQSLSLGSVVLSLFLQPLIGTLTAMSFLKEPMSLGQWLGGFFIVLAVMVQILAESRESKRKSAISLT